jgi:hypothetical protein
MMPNCSRSDNISLHSLTFIVAPSCGNRTSASVHIAIHLLNVYSDSSVLSGQSLLVYAVGD